MASHSYLSLYLLQLVTLLLHSVSMGLELIIRCRASYSTSPSLLLFWA